MVKKEELTSNQIEAYTPLYISYDIAETAFLANYGDGNPKKFNKNKSNN